CAISYGYYFDYW
nr:immunoglobulin heavy chain junction region [Mus musculus]MBK4189285.1 immunoglobulin heavy chain junction region [Mus musculus]MBK4189286.1 immunoglobulin heavy chain junction region [Mus musculus]MBK4189287.1 immunoglobulin heavy chain junction region [Mus musculus]MBK4189288.1 immunoglobulin heavy chain junction region [Mus musculus]